MSTPSQTGLPANAQAVQRDLESLRSLLPAELVSSIVALVPQTADPAQALNLFERLSVAGGNKLAAVLENNRPLLQYVLAIFGQSYWLGEVIIKNPDIVDSLAREAHPDRPLEREDFRRCLARFRSNCPQTDISALLVEFKKREYIGIALRDILGISTLAETTAELSALADVILEQALLEAQSEMQERFGGPAGVHGKAGQVSVVSLGKLGGNELNYSSDLDLLYLYRDEDSSDPVAARDYFTRQFQLLTGILCRTTAEGPLFRIDLRLRPRGGEGEITIGLHQALHYYRHDAHDWELQALIKVRHSAGDQVLSNEFIAGVQPHVYTEDVNFAAIDTALRSRERTQARRRLRPFRSNQTGALDVKLDRGGIRDIEFLTQCLQRTYGGEEKWLRSGGTLFSLQKLHDKGHISGRDFHELTHAYEFLRAVEHRLQLQRGQQTHRFPTEPRSLAALCRAIASRLNTQASADPGQSSLEHMQRVSRIYDRIIFSHKLRQKHAGEAAPTAPTASTAREMSFEQLLEQLVQDSPELHDIAARGYPVHTRRNLHRFLSSAMTSSERYAALLENPTTVERAIPLLDSSDYLADILIRHPDAIRALDTVSAESATRLPQWSQDVVASPRPLDALRRSFRTLSFAIGAQDVLAPRPALQSMRETSAAADAAISQVLRIIGAEDILAVFALGRLGTDEFDIASDADLLFVRSADADQELARAAAEKLIHALGAYTREGLIFAVDTRLRPHGSEGELVVSPAQLERYLAEEARPWEALTYTKLRFVAGRKDLSAVTLPLVWHRIVETASRPNFAAAVKEMRARLEKSNRYPDSFKLARGGFYDIDFIVSFLVLRGCSLASGNTLERLEHLRHAGLLGSAVFEELRDAALLYRTADHVIRLVTGRPRPELPAAEHARDAVEGIIDRILDRSGITDLQQSLNTTAERVRTIFRQIICS